MIRLNWKGFDLAIEHLGLRIKLANNVTALYAVPRGGLVVGVALSHFTGLPLTTELGPGVMIVDDIIDTGKTIRDIRRAHGDLPAAAWIGRQRAGIGNCMVSSKVDHDEWFLFPWELRAAADEDERSYNASRQ